MLSIISFIQTFFADRRDDDKGAAMVEYGLLVAGIAVIVGVAALALGNAIVGLFNQVITAL
jgi:pilus assembly protein Flp/PilA